MRYKASTLRIIEKLKELYPEGLCSLQYKKDYELLFAVRLSAQCTDARVNLVTPALFARYPTLEAFAAADVRSCLSTLRGSLLPSVMPSRPVMRMQWVSQT